MKNIIYLLITLCLVACGGNDDSNKRVSSSLVGTWSIYSADITGEVIITSTPQGDAVSGGLIKTNFGNYEIGDTIVITPTQISLYNKKQGYTVSLIDQVISPDNNVITVGSYEIRTNHHPNELIKETVTLTRK